MVESNATAATEMALRLHAKHCWCITGTPIQRKLDDLYGLLRFLKASPFDATRWWIEVIRDPYEKRDARAIEFTHKIFKQLMWRSSKEHVAYELQLPPQEECVSWLTFSAIEEHFYKRQHETCESYAREVIESLKREIRKRGHDYEDNPLITHAEAAKLLTSLLKLRQACCHPQVGSSGLCSLQQAPMTMDDILMVLVNKTKTEGEEALRALVVALNGLAAIAVIKQERSQAVELYKEALDITKEHAADFRLDPLLNIHILHNLAEMLPMVENCTKKTSADMDQCSGRSKRKIELQADNQDAAKKQRIGESVGSCFVVSPQNSPTNASTDLKFSPKGSTESDDECQSLEIACRRLKDKYLSGFSSKLSAAQQEFNRSYIQVCNALSDMEKQQSTWWLDTLQLAEEDKNFSRELIRKIEEAIHGTLNNSNSSRLASRFRTTHGMKLHLQTSLDMMEVSRKKLIDRLLEIDQTMENPKEEDIECISNCKYCNRKDDGPTCFLCELDRLFQDYVARLFRLNKSRKGVMESADAEEAVDLQKKNSALNHFFSTLSSKGKDLTSIDEELTKRDANNRVTVSKSPSETEIVLGVIKSHCRSYLATEGKLAATKHLWVLEAMRKEYAHARALAIAQAQFLRAHDEIKMATTRLQLREFEGDLSIYTLSLDELDSASVQNTSDKILAASSLLSIKGKLRYLKGLIKSKQNVDSPSPDHPALTPELAPVSASMELKSEYLPKGEESCPICQENVRNQKMVFQCGHVTCCKCLLSMTEPRTVHDNHQKWVMCPICRQHTDIDSIAYVDDRRSKPCNTSAAEGVERNEASLTVKGSYGTKIEAVSRRILWIKSSDPEAKVLVFSSWKDVLDVLEHALVANGITFVRMIGGRKAQAAISQFKGEKSPEKERKKRNVQKNEARSIQVLLLLIQHGANGLNLLEAQHVMLVEPLLNPAAEAQAVSRVHLIGQDKTTLVHRFIVKGTVEESLYKLNRSRSTNSSSFISGNKKNQDQPFLTLKDIESLFTTMPNSVPETEERPGENLRDLPPSVAAAIAAERRLKENAARTSLT